LLLLTLPPREAPARQTGIGAKAAPVPLAKGDAPAQARLSADYGRLPLSFEANQGQTDPWVKFLSRGKGYSLLLTPTEAVLVLSSGTENGQPEQA
jgi:hypothetical protein